MGLPGRSPSHPPGAGPESACVRDGVCLACCWPFLARRRDHVGLNATAGADICATSSGMWTRVVCPVSVARVRLPCAARPFLLPPSYRIAEGLCHTRPLYFKRTGAAEVSRMARCGLLSSRHCSGPLRMTRRSTSVAPSSRACKWRPWSTASAFALPMLRWAQWRHAAVRCGAVRAACWLGTAVRRFASSMWRRRRQSL
jgi:hypothetical protein